jgi:hypothetical protein
MSTTLQKLRKINKGKKTTTNMDNLQGGEPKIDIQKHLADAPYIECEKCGGTQFVERMMIKRISKFLTGGTQDSITPVPIVACAKCDNINELFKPKL